MTPLLLLAGLALCAVFVGRVAFVAVHRRRSPRHPSVAWSSLVEHVDPDGFVVEDTGLPRWDGSKGP